MAHKLLGEATQAIFAPQTLRKQREQVGNQLAILVVPPPIAVKILFNFRARGRYDDLAMIGEVGRRFFRPAPRCPADSLGPP
jgi:hypothetical protein